MSDPWSDIAMDVDVAREAQELRAEVERLRALSLALLAAAKDVQEHWSDPSCYTHNRLLTPMLVHEDTIRALEEKS